MIRFIAPVLLFATSALADGPLSLSSRTPVGELAAKGVVVGIEETQRGTVTTTTAVAYSKKKWKKSKVGLPKLEVDATDPDPDAADKAVSTQAAFDGALERTGITELPGLPGGVTGRFRHMDWELTVYLENDQVLARVGDTSDIESLPVVKDFTKLAGKCVGTRENALLHVVAFQTEKAIGVVVESTCRPENPDKPVIRLRRFIVADVAKILAK